MRKIVLVLAAAVVLLALTGCSADEGAPFPRLEGLAPFAVSAPARFHDGPVTEFIPMNYGEITPFLGALITTEWHRVNDNERFGFIDAQGRIIVDPVFCSVRLIERGGERVWVVSRHWLPAGEELGRYWLGESPIQGYEAIISPCGSIFERFDEVHDSWFTRDIELDYIPVRRGDKWGAIDFNGNVAADFAHPNPPLFSYGLAPVFPFMGFDWSWDYFYHEVPFHYINAAGEIVLGPFETPPPGHFFEGEINLYTAVFRHGLAMHFYNGRYGFINTAGELVIDRDFEYFNNRQIGWNSAGLALAALADTSEAAGWQTTVDFVLVDKAGNITALARGDSRNVDMRDGIITIADPNRDYVSAFDEWGNHIGTFGGRARHTGAGYFIQNEWAGNVRQSMRIFGNGADRTFYAESHISVSHLFGDWFRLICTQTGDAKTHWNAQTDEERGAAAFGFWWRQSNRNIVYTGDWEQRLFGVADDDANLIIDITFDVLRIIGENYFAAQGRYGGLLGPDGGWIVRVPLTTNFD